MEIIINKNTKFYHTSYIFKGLYEGRLIYFSNNILYSLKNISGVKKLVSHFSPCCNYDENSPIYVYKNTRKLKLFHLNNEAEINFLQMKIGNQNLIYFLHKNNYDGFISYNNFKKNLGVILMFIKDKKDFKLSKVYPNKGELDNLKCDQLFLYWVYKIITMTLEILINFHVYCSIKEKIYFLKKKDILQFKKKYSKLINYKRNKKRSLRIASYNVHYFRNTSDDNTLNQIVDFIDKQDLDVVCLQEIVIPRKFYEGIYLNSLDEVTSAFKRINFKYFIYDKESFLFVVSKVKPFSSKTIDLGNGRKAINFNIFYNNEIINITNTHLHTDTSMYKVKNQIDENIRFDQIKFLIKNLENYKSKQIILGDLNSLKESDYTEKQLNYKRVYEYAHTPNENKVINEIEKNGFIDSNKFSKNNKNLYTSIYSRRVDYIFTKNINRIIYYNTSNFKFSDHSLILIEL